MLTWYKYTVIIKYNHTKEGFKLSKDKKRNIRFSYRKMNDYYRGWRDNPVADQTMKNFIHSLKKEGKYTLYLAAQAAYNRIKLERELDVE